MRQLIIYLNLALLLSGAFAYAGDLFHGVNFSVKLPSPPQVSHTKVTGDLGEAYSWKYQGTSASDEATIAYGIEHLRVESNVFLLLTEAEVADILVERVLTAAGPMRRILSAGQLAHSLTKGGFGVEVLYWNGDLFRLRVIVSKPRVWLLSVVAIGSKIKAVEIQKEIFDTFVIHDPKSLAKLQTPDVT